MEIRCKHCGALLMKAGNIECVIKCRKCHAENSIVKVSQAHLWQKYLKPLTQNAKMIQ